MDYTFDRPSHWLQWAQATFGDVALDRHERALRFIEEAIELAQALEIDPSTIDAIAARVFSRPAGDPEREFGQCLACFEILAKVAGIDADREATAELARVKSIPAEEWAKRHAAKRSIGIALP